MPRIDQLFERTVAKYRGCLALVDGDLRWTYAQLQTQARALQERLKDQGLSKGDRVVLWLKNSGFYIAAYLAALGLEAIVVPVHANAPVSEVLKIVSHVQATALVTSSTKWEKHAEELRLCSLRFALWPEASVPLRGRMELPTPPAGLAQILYTSGTTGNPKGVMLSHDNLVANVESILARLALTSTDSIVAVLPFVFSYGNSVLLTHLLSGAKIVIEENLAFARCVVDSMSRESVTGFSGVASHYAFLLRDSGFRSSHLPSLRYLTSAGGPMPRALLEKVREAVPEAEFHVMYGQTEATARITMLAPKEIERKAGSAGRPIAGISIRIVNEEGELLPSGVQGEISVAGRNVMEGYWKDENGIAATLKGGWLATGDIGFLDDEGYLFITGRGSEIIKTGGFRVSPEEIEELLLGCEDVLEAGVAGVKDELMGQTVVAGVVQKPGRNLSLRHLMAFCANHLAPFKRPQAIYRIEKVPRSMNGKVLRRELEQELTALQTGPTPNRSQA